LEQKRDVGKLLVCSIGLAGEQSHDLIDIGEVVEHCIRPESFKVRETNSAP
jgi:hypothetical protein